MGNDDYCTVFQLIRKQIGPFIFDEILLNNISDTIWNGLYSKNKNCESTVGGHCGIIFETTMGGGKTTLLRGLKSLPGVSTSYFDFASNLVQLFNQPRFSSDGRRLILVDNIDQVHMKSLVKGIADQIGKLQSSCYFVVTSTQQNHVLTTSGITNLSLLGLPLSIDLITCKQREIAASSFMMDFQYNSPRAAETIAAKSQGFSRGDLLHSTADFCHHLLVNESHESSSSPISRTKVDVFLDGASTQFLSKRVVELMGVSSKQDQILTAILAPFSKLESGTGPFNSCSGDLLSIFRPTYHVTLL